MGERCLLLSGRFGGERAEAALDGGQFELDGVRLDEPSSAAVLAGALIGSL